MQYHSLKICGLTRKLPIIAVGKKTKIASFSILGDVELVEKVAKEFAMILKNYHFDFLVGPEVKVVPLIHALAKILEHKKYVICRKSIKPNMVSPLVVKPQSHFPKHARPLVLDGSDAQLIKNKKVVIIDDVISTGVTLRMMKYLMDKVGAEVIGFFVIIKQGEQFDQFENLNFLAELPVFKLKD